MTGTVSDIYDELTEMFLNEKEGPKQDQAVQTDCISPEEIANICQRQHIDMNTFSRRMVQGGDDCCYKEKEELGVDHLEACGKCKRAFYCSRECQRKHWKAGHKTACRAPHDIRPGDLFKLHNLKKKCMNFRVVKVVGADPKNESRWEVMFFDDKTPNVSVAADKLLHLRPLT